MIAKSFHQITEFKKTINKNLNHIAKVKKAMAKIAGSFSDKHTNRDQFAYRASQ